KARPVPLCFPVMTRCLETPALAPSLGRQRRKIGSECTAGASSIDELHHQGRIEVEFAWPFPPYVPNCLTKLTLVRKRDTGGSKGSSRFRLSRDCEKGVPRLVGAVLFGGLSESPHDHDVRVQLIASI